MLLGNIVGYLTILVCTDTYYSHYPSFRVKWYNSVALSIEGKYIISETDEDALKLWGC